MVSIDDFNYSNVLIETKLYDNEADLTNKKNFYKDGSLKECNSH